MALRVKSSSTRTAVAPPKSPQDTFLDRMRKVYVAQMQRTDPRPQKIVDRLYLGSVGAAYTKSILKSHKITHILTVCDCLPPKFPGEFEYKVVSVADDPSVKLILHFRECLEFVHGAIQGGGTVLVHCFAGVSRSATIVIAYLMKYHKMEMREALTFVRSKRPWVNPNFGFMGQLRRFGIQLKEQNKKVGLIE